MEPSSLAEATISYIGCITTFVILYLWPYKQYFSGCLGRPSPILFNMPSPPDIIFPPPPHRSHIYCSFNNLFYFSSSITCFLSFAIDDHFFSNTSLISTLETDPVATWIYPFFDIPVSSAKISADWVNLFFTRYSCMAAFNSSFCLDVNPTIFDFSLIN